MSHKYHASLKSLVNGVWVKSLLIATLAFLYGCAGDNDSQTGGASGDGNTTTVVLTNQTPTVAITNDTQVFTLQQIVLNAEVADADGDMLSMRWELIDNGGTDLSIPLTTSSTLAFTVPSVTSTTQLTFQLTASDASSSASDTIDISINTRSRVLFGPLDGATVTIALLNSPDNIIDTVTTLSGSDTDNVMLDVGVFTFLLEGVADDAWLIATSYGGMDIDPNDDGVFGTGEAIGNIGNQRIVAQASDFRSGVIINVLTELSVIELERTTIPFNELALNVNLIQQTLDTVATQFILPDASGNTPTFADVSSFSPYTDRNRLTVDYDTQLLPIAQQLIAGDIAQQVNNGADVTNLVQAANIALNNVPIIEPIDSIETTLGSNVNFVASVNESNVVFEWTQVAGTPLDIGATNTSTIDFTVPNNIPVNQTLTFEVKVIDTERAETTQQVNVSISNSNIQPTVTISGVRAGFENETLTLTASANDMDGTIRSYQWFNVRGTDSFDVAIPNAQSPEITIRLPEVCADGGLLELLLLVTDNRDGQVTQTLSIDIEDVNQLPTIQFSVIDGSTFNDNTALTISATADEPDPISCGAITNYSWVQVAGPAVLNLTNATGMDETSISMLLPDAPSEGLTITFALTVIDAAIESSRSEVSFMVQDINRPPTVSTSSIASVINEGSSTTLMVTANDSDSGDSISRIEWRQISGVATLLSATNTSQIVVTAPEINNNTETVTFEVTAFDNAGSSATTQISIDIINLIRPASISIDDQMIISPVSETVTGTISVTVIGSNSNNFQLSVLSQPINGTVSLQQQPNGGFSYQFNSLDALVNGDSFIIMARLNDVDQADTATVSIVFAENGTPTLTLSPMAGAINITTSPTITLTSNFPLDTTSITDNNGSTACVGSIQLMQVNNLNCIPLSVGVASNFNRQVSVSVLQRLLPNTQYLLLTNGVQSIYNVLATNVSHTFNTTRGLILVTEVSTSINNDQPRWFEVFNPSNEPLNLEDFSLRSQRIATTDSDQSITATFALGNFQLDPGGFMVIRAQSSDPNQQFIDGPGIMHVGDASIRPFWNSNGFVELITNDTVPVTADYVAFGGGLPNPLTAQAWTGSNAEGIPQIPDSSLTRLSTNQDTNSNTDFTISNFTTPGGPNDVSCSADSNNDVDQDGIPDCSEIEGSTYAGIDLYAMGARTSQRDIFIEIDYMESTTTPQDVGLIPSLDALNNIVERFESNGIVIHFDVGTLAGETMLEGDSQTVVPRVNNFGGGNQMSFINAIDFERVNSATQINVVTSFFDVKLQNFDLRRLPIFHYLLMANSQSNNGEISMATGAAEQGGNDILMTLGNNRLLPPSIPTLASELINTQAAAIMHQLGHNLGLQHGGNESVDYKPNYLSVMNSLYQLQGIPNIADNAGDRYYASVFAGSSSATNCVANTLTFAVDTDDFIVNYSDGSSDDLNENSLIESIGFRMGGDSSDVDYNCDGDRVDGAGTATFSFNINAQDTNQTDSLTTLTDYNDWTNLDLIFQDNGVNSLNKVIPNQDSLQLMPNALMRDQQAIWEYHQSR